MAKYDILPSQQRRDWYLPICSQYADMNHFKKVCLVTKALRFIPV